jgi:small subunit ribosomal protein S5
VLELGGVRDVLTKSIGTQNPINLVKATMDGLIRLRRPEEVAELRGLTVSQVLGLQNGASANGEHIDALSTEDAAAADEAPKAEEAAPAAETAASAEAEAPAAEVPAAEPAVEETPAPAEEASS